MKTRTALALLACWLLGSTLFAQAPAVPGAPDILDDDAIVAHIEAQGTALIRAGKTPKMKTLRTALAAARTCALPLPVPEAPPLTPEELFARRANGVVIVGVLSRAKKKGKFELAGCTGFALAEGGVIVTNYHVIDSPEAEAIVIMSRDGTVAPVLGVLAGDKLADVAIVRAAGITAPPLPLALARPAPGSPVWAISHPDHNFYSLTAGVVSRHFIATTDFGKTPQMAVTADFGAGSSGGPLFDRSGSVTGMVCSTTSVYWEDAKGKAKELQMVFKHCVPAESIRRLVSAPAP
jgi:S1-C subfamily serine protease